MCLCLVACSGNPKRGGEAAEGADAPSQEFALPQVPVVLTSPEERAAYVLSHFWDNLPLNDTAYCHHAELMEQNVVNFLSLLPVADEEARAEGFRRTLQTVAADSVTFRLVTGIVARYLDDPNSPMRNEEQYIIYLESLLGSSLLDEAERLRPAYRLQQARKNRKGTKAADFSFIDRAGRTGRLYDTQASLLLLVFYDPACDHCAEILRDVDESPVVAGMLADRRLTLLAVYTEGDRELWDKTKQSLPRSWHVGFDTTRIVERELYSLPAMPVLYLLNQDKTVLLKDASLSEIEQALL